MPSPMPMPMPMPMPSPSPSPSPSPQRQSELADLLELVGAGSRSAFAALYDQLAAFVFGVARSSLTQPMLAERVTEETFLALWQGAPRYNRDKQDPMRLVLSTTRRIVARHRP